MDGLQVSGGKGKRISKGLESGISNQSLGITGERELAVEGPFMMGLYR